LRKSVTKTLKDEESLRRSIKRHLRSLGFTTTNGRLYHGSDDKQRIRDLHRNQRFEKLSAAKLRLVSQWRDLIGYTATGKEIDIRRISPRLELIEGRSWQSELFAFASLYWSIPTSQGYGRRMRFLCWDDSNGKLIGLIALGDPVFNLRVRDAYIGWTGNDRVKRLSCVMDAYVLGALPPYNKILAGKLVACLLRSKFIADAFRSRYSNQRTIISGRKQKRALAVVTTSSALGRSSVYNRLRIGDDVFLRSVGLTRGFGHFHVPSRLFTRMRSYLGEKGHEYANGHEYGQGANWRMRVIRETLSQLELPPQLLRHGISREVFVAEIGTNSREYLRGEAKDLNATNQLEVDEIAIRAMERWVLPRAERDPSFKSWNHSDFLQAIGVEPTRRGSLRIASH